MGDCPGWRSYGGGCDNDRMIVKGNICKEWSSLIHKRDIDRSKSGNEMVLMD